MDMLEALKQASYLIHSSEIACGSFVGWVETLEEGAIQKMVEMEGGDEMTITINSEFSVFIEDILSLHSEVIRVNALGEPVVEED
jgi:hypothetical protein